MNIIKEKYHLHQPTVPKQTIAGYDKVPVGWCSHSVRDIMQDICTEDTKLIVDGGCWKGMSAYYWLKHAPNADVICIDHWQGSTEHQNNKDIENLYEIFNANMWEYRDRIIPIKAHSIVGYIMLKGLNLYPDIIYIDWSHDYDSVKCDLTHALRLFPEALICGDDWTWESVKNAVNDVCREYKKDVWHNDKAWRLI